VDLQLVGVKDEVTEAIALVNLGGDSECALVAKLAAELDVMEGERVVRRLSPDQTVLACGIGKHCIGCVKLAKGERTKLGGYLCRTP
jgi:hypothetical protein